MSGGDSISKRKADHIEVAASGSADFRERSTLLEHVHLIHQSLPELSAAEIDLSSTLVGRPMAAPIIISGMTGGTAEAGSLNRDLAAVAEELGIAFGLGSQRAMAEHPELEATYRVRDDAPSVFLIGNLGAVQARAYGPERVADLVRRIDANAIALHLNPAQEMIQADGDRDFRGVLDAIAELVQTLPVPVIVKETGCGLSQRAATALVQAGVTAVDVSGAGGTSWVAVEAERAAADSPHKALGTLLWDWGIPTAVSTAICAAQGLEVVASGGLRSGFDVARAVALGASAGGLAAPVLRAHQAGGRAAVRALLTSVIDTVRTVMLLCGASNLAELRACPQHLSGELRHWFHDLGLR